MCLDFLRILAIDFLKAEIIDLRGQSFEYLFAVFQSQNPVSIPARQGQKMQRADYADAFPVYLSQVLHNAVCRSRIEAGYRLIGQDQSRILHQGPGYANSLLLTAGKVFYLFAGIIL